MVYTINDMNQDEEAKSQYNHMNVSKCVISLKKKHGFWLCNYANKNNILHRRITDEGFSTWNAHMSILWIKMVYTSE